MVTTGWLEYLPYGVLTILSYEGVNWVVKKLSSMRKEAKQEKANAASDLECVRLSFKAYKEHTNLWCWNLSDRIEKLEQAAKKKARRK